MVDEKKIIEDMAEEIENLCGRETNLTKKARKLLEIKELDWIPWSESLPEDSQRILVTTIDREVHEYIWDELHCRLYLPDGKTYRSVDDMLAWMPLPEPWEGE